MGQYRVSRNIEKSIIDRITEILSLCSFSATVEKTFTNAYKVPAPVIVVRVGNTNYDGAEISTTQMIRSVQVLIDIFGATDGNRLDLKDCLVAYLKDGIPYKEYTVTSGAIDGGTQNGRLRVISMDDSIVNLNTDKATLDDHDKFRHLITLTVGLGRVE